VSRQFGVEYSESGIKALLHRIGASYHKTEAGPDTRRYYVDACRPVWGLECLCCCWLLVGQRFLVGVGDGRRRLNILGAYRPDDQEYLLERVPGWKEASHSVRVRRGDEPDGLRAALASPRSPEGLSGGAAGSDG
jgi:hypothetical protein